MSAPALPVPAVLASLALAVLGAGAPGVAAPGIGAEPLATSDVAIVNFAYDPADLTVDAGDAVRFTNDDPFTHTATAFDGSFDTDLLDGGESAVLAMPLPGVFPYFCAVHPVMEGVVRVRDPAALPDLQVSAIDAVETTPGVSMEVKVTVLNDALNDAGASVVTLAYVEGDGLVSIGARSLGPLAPGQEGSVKFAWQTLGLVGDFVVVAVADAGEDVAEADEADNEARRTVSVLVPGVPGTDLPGLLGL